MWMADAQGVGLSGPRTVRHSTFRACLVAALCESAPRRTRTYDPLIKSRGEHSVLDAANAGSERVCATDYELVLKWLLA